MNLCSPGRKQGGVLRLRRGRRRQVHREADGVAERRLRPGPGHRQGDRQQRLPDPRGTVSQFSTTYRHVLTFQCSCSVIAVRNLRC